MREPLLIAIMGPTASGKSDVAESLADSLGLQLVNADAFMVYSGLDIGTNKPARKAEYGLIDIVGPDEEFGVGEYVRRASDLLWQIYNGSPSPLQGGGGANNESPSHPTLDPAPLTLNPPPRGAVVVGGTGFYVRALFEEYTGLMPAPDPALRERLEDREQREGLSALAQELAEKAPEIAQATDLQNPVRVRRALEKLADPRPPIEFKLPPFAKSKFILDPPQDDLDAAIARRVDAMLAAGWEHEVRTLLDSGLNKSSPALRAIGYQSMIGLIEGRLSKEEARLKTITETRQYAKRQRTWLRSEPSAHVVPTGNDTSKSVLECLKIPGQ